MAEEDAGYAESLANRSQGMTVMSVSSYTIASSMCSMYSATDMPLGYRVRQTNEHRVLHKRTIFRQRMSCGILLSGIMNSVTG